VGGERSAFRAGREHSLVGDVAKVLQSRLFREKEGERAGQGEEKGGGGVGESATQQRRKGGERRGGQVGGGGPQGGGRAEEKGKEERTTLRARNCVEQ